MGKLADNLVDYILESMQGDSKKDIFEDGTFTYKHVNRDEIEISLTDYKNKEFVEREHNFLWTSITITGFEVEGLALNARAHWIEEESAWIVEGPTQVSSDRITLYFDDSWVGWMLGWLQPFELLSSKLVEEHVLTILGTSMDEYSQSHLNQLFLKRTFTYWAFWFCMCFFFPKSEFPRHEIHKELIFFGFFGTIFFFVFYWVVAWGYDLFLILFLIFARFT